MHISERIGQKQYTLGINDLIEWCDPNCRVDILLNGMKMHLGEEIIQEAELIELYVKVISSIGSNFQDMKLWGLNRCLSDHNPL